MKIKFAEGFKSNTLDFQNGEYRRSFDRKDQPFEITNEEWTTLRRTKVFEPFTEPPPPPQGEQSEGRGQQQEAATQKRADKAQKNQSEEK